MQLLSQFPAISACLHPLKTPRKSHPKNSSLPFLTTQSTTTVSREKLAQKPPPTTPHSPAKHTDKSHNNGSIGNEKKTEHNGGKQSNNKGLRLRKSKKFAPWVRSDQLKEKSLLEKKKRNRVKLSGVEGEMRRKLDMCSKYGDLMGAMEFYEWSIAQGIDLELYHYNVLLYLCASAAAGVVKPAKSGTDGGFRGSGDNRGAKGVDSENYDGTSGFSIHVSGGVREFAWKKGLEIFERMCVEKIDINEAAFTSVARIAMSMGDGDMAFEIVKRMKDVGIIPRLRSYGPALFTFCDNGDVEKAFEVEEHMLQSGVCPDEPELEALLRASVAARGGDKVYYLLHKLRTTVRQVSATVADLIEGWFKSSAASRFGKRKWDVNMVAEAMRNGGGGWHGLGWLGKGKWRVARTHVNADGMCMSCAENLVTIDLDPIETENFAKSVASLASKRERNSSFQKFQKWLDEFGPFEAVIDAANVGLFSQGRFSTSKVNAVAKTISQKLQMKRGPLIIVHNKRLSGDEMNKIHNMKLLEKWKNADAIYATPTGSNDDWYWLYAAIKCKCLIVTNDEMRDHLFQTLGNDFFPRWKERHQVYFTFQDGSFEFRLPPPYSVVIQETERGHWHIPISMDYEDETRRTWLCVTRGALHDETEEAPVNKENLIMG